MSKENVVQDNADEKVFYIAHQYIKDLSFEHNLTEKDLINPEDTDEPETGLSLAVEVQEVEKDIFAVDLNITVETTKKEDKVYLLEISYRGLTMVKNFSDEEKQALLMVETPKLLFPFTRSIISSTIQEGGFPPFTIAPIDFMALYIDNLEKSQENNDTTQVASND